MTQIAKPYLTGTTWRCKIKTNNKWGWCRESTADMPEEAARRAREHVDALELGEGPAQQKEVKVAKPVAEPEPEVQHPTGPRIRGPHPHYGGVRFEVVSASGRRWAPTRKTEAEARRVAERMAATTAEQGNLTIQDSINALVEHERQNGMRPATLEGTRRGLEAFFAGMLHGPMSRVNPQLAQAQYDQLRAVVDPRTGRQLSVDTTRCYLKHAKQWARWIVKKGWMRGASPLDGIVGIGRKRKGKPQLTQHLSYHLDQAWSNRIRNPLCQVLRFIFREFRHVRFTRAVLPAPASATGPTGELGYAGWSQVSEPWAWRLVDGKPDQCGTFGTMDSTGVHHRW